MGINNQGNQTILTKFETPIDSPVLNKLINNVIDVGIYYGMTLTKSSNTSVLVSSGDLVIKNTVMDGTVKINFKDSSIVNLPNTTTNWFIVCEWEYRDEIEWYAEIKTVVAPQQYHVILGQCIFNLGELSQTFNLTQRTYAYRCSQIYEKIETSYVNYSINNQGLTSTQKENARTNIDVYSKSEADTRYVNVDGDSIVGGSLTIDSSSEFPLLVKTSGEGHCIIKFDNTNLAKNTYIQLYKNGIQFWDVGVDDSGRDDQFYIFNKNVNDRIFKISNSTLTTSLKYALTVGTGLTVTTGGATINGTMAVNGTQVNTVSGVSNNFLLTNTNKNGYADVVVKNDSNIPFGMWVNGSSVTGYGGANQAHIGSSSNVNVNIVTNNTVNAVFPSSGGFTVKTGNVLIENGYLTVQEVYNAGTRISWNTVNPTYGRTDIINYGGGGGGGFDFYIAWQSAHTASIKAASIDSSGRFWANMGAIVTGTFSVSSTSTLSGAVTLDSTLTVAGVTTFNNNVVINSSKTFSTGTGAVSLRGAVTATSTFSIMGGGPKTLYVKNSVDNDTRLEVDGHSSGRTSYMRFSNNGNAKFDTGYSPTNGFYIYNHATGGGLALTLPPDNVNVKVTTYYNGLVNGATFYPLGSTLLALNIFSNDNNPPINSQVWLKLQYYNNAVRQVLVYTTDQGLNATTGGVEGTWVCRGSCRSVDTSGGVYYSVFVQRIG